MEHDEYALKMDSKLLKNVMLSYLLYGYIHTVVHTCQNSIVQIAFLNYFCAFVEHPL